MPGEIEYSVSYGKVFCFACFKPTQSFHIPDEMGCVASKKERLSSGDQGRRTTNFTGSIFISKFVFLELMSRGQDRRHEYVSWLVSGKRFCIF